MDLSSYEHLGHQQRTNIAQRQNIPIDFMDQVISKLKHAGLIKSIRGRNGGLLLAKASKDISLWDIFSACEDHISPVKCLEEKSCDLMSCCISIYAWEDVFSGIKKQLSHSTLEAVVHKWQNNSHHHLS